MFDQRLLAAVRSTVDAPIRFLQVSDLHYLHDTAGWHRNSVHREHDSSILLCTHDMAEAEELCDRVGIMVGGRIISLDEPEPLKRLYARNGELPTLEEAFMAATGYSVEEASAEE